MSGQRNVIIKFRKMQVLRFGSWVLEVSETYTFEYQGVILLSRTARHEIPRKTSRVLISSDPYLPKRSSASTRNLKRCQANSEASAYGRTPLVVLGMGLRQSRSCRIVGTAGFERWLKLSGPRRVQTHLVVHYFGVCLFDIIGKERSNTINHFVEHCA